MTSDPYDYSMTTIAHHLAEISRALGYQVGIAYDADGNLAAFIIGSHAYLAARRDIDVWAPIEQA